MSSKQMTPQSILRTRLAFSWAGIATIACFYLVLFNGENPSQQSLPWTMSSSVRGEDNASILHIGSDISKILVVVRAPSYWEDKELSSLDVFLPSGSQLTSLEVTAEEIEKGNIMLFLDVGENPEMGLYRVVFRLGGVSGDGDGDLETQFELRGM
jgi:hypothetical protein